MYRRSRGKGRTNPPSFFLENGDKNQPHPKTKNRKEKENRKSEAASKKEIRSTQELERTRNLTTRGLEVKPCEEKSKKQKT